MGRIVATEYVTLDGVMEEPLMRRDLVDELRLMVHPILLGSGKRLFPEGTEKKVSKLVDTKTFRSGITVLTYEPAGMDRRQES
jgi:dihydrofolate reductase